MDQGYCRPFLIQLTGLGHMTRLQDARASRRRRENVVRKVYGRILFCCVELYIELD
jgi:hypothetical protein